MSSRKPRRRPIGGPWAILALLTAAVAVNIMDRQLPFIMAEQIRLEFQLSDTQIGLLGGFAFSLVYALGALPMARIADRWSRKMVLAGSMMFWSLCTGLGALSATYVQLMLSRAGVAIGEAGAAPTSHSMIADLFPVERRGKAMAIHTAGISLGVLLALSLGGVLLGFLNWRTVMLLASIPGVLLAVVFTVLVAEPKRIGATQPAPPPISAAVATVVKQQTFIWIVLGATLGILAGSGGATFGPSFFIRVHGLSTGEAGVLFGLVMGGGGAIGGIISGAIADHLVRRDQRWMLWIPALGALLKAPLWIAGWSVGGVWGAAALLLLALLMGSSILPLSYAATQSIAAPRLRAFYSAVLQLVLNLLGNVLGPLSIGMISDHLRPEFGERGLGVALATASIALLASAACYARAANSLRRDMQSARELEMSVANMSVAAREART